MRALAAQAEEARLKHDWQQLQQRRLQRELTRTQNVPPLEPPLVNPFSAAGPSAAGIIPAETQALLDGAPVPNHFGALPALQGIGVLGDHDHDQSGAPAGLSAMGANKPPVSAAAGPSAIAGVSSDLPALAIHRHDNDIEGQRTKRTMST